MTERQASAPKQATTRTAPLQYSTASTQRSICSGRRFEEKSAARTMEIWSVVEHKNVYKICSITT